MDDLLTPVSTRYFDPSRQAKHKAALSIPARPEIDPAKVTTPEEALQVLKRQPDYEALIAILRYLTSPTAHPKAFQIQLPGPKSAALVHVLVTEIVLNYWPLLLETSLGGELKPQPLDTSDVGLLLQCLRSVSGLNAVEVHLKALIRDAQTGKESSRRPDIGLNIGLFLNLLATLLNGEQSLRALWAFSVSALPDSTQQKIQTQQLLSLVTGGRILSAAAEASRIAGEEETAQEAKWTSDGVAYSRWIAKNLACWLDKNVNEEELHFCCECFRRALSLGYPETLVTTIVDELLLSSSKNPEAFAKLCLPPSLSTKKVVHFLLQYLSRRFLNSVQLTDPSPCSIISACAGLLRACVADEDPRKAQLIDWCTESSGAGLGETIGIRRVVLAVLAQDKALITDVLEKSLTQFGDLLYIKHTPILQQEVHAQVVLLSAGYVSRLSPVKYTTLLRSRVYLTTISNRIASTQRRARFLGMVIGECLSSLADMKTKKLDFQIEEMETGEAEALKQLSGVSDLIGEYDSVLSHKTQEPLPVAAESKPRLKKPRKPKKGAEKLVVSVPPPKAIIEEVNSSDTEEEDSLKPYLKGSDPEDSDDDATLVRDRPKAPVYIRDLIAYLRASDNYDKQKLALQTAPVLIRRKAGHGTEVSLHADELARLLVGLQDNFDMDDFTELRQQGMMALAVAQPASMGPWFVRSFFEGDFSISQRTSVLVALGLGARELAGLESSSYQSAASFPSKKLPNEIEQFYLESKSPAEEPPASRLKALPPDIITSISQSLTSAFLGPLAATAADAASGPDVFKLQTFTARYKSKAKIRPRVRAIPNTTAALLAKAFFYPLTAYLQIALQSTKPAVLNPVLLSLYLQTLGIVVNAAGPSTLSLPQMTSELWDLLLRVRTYVLEDQSALKGWLVAMVVLLEVNEGDMRRLCSEQASDFVGTRSWVSAVFERLRGEDGGEENEVKMLAAGVLIKMGEAIEKYQALLMGDLIGFT